MKIENETRDRDLIFALDIGTRNIIGVVGQVEDERLRVLAIEREEHGKRAMLDGQIEDIDQVARMTRRVKERLEERLSCTLTRVCVAAAGRALRMERAKAVLEFSELRRIDEDLIGRLEAEAITEAERHLSEGQPSERSDEPRQFFLVGYTVTQYWVDHYPMTTLKGHNGQIVEAEVVATFLPGEVVESLYTVVEKAGIEVASLTLEPIAALNAVIPAELRLLNLVLADIGAGTSDIAACRSGSVVGYTMATIAGDEITEALMEQFLVDFRTAERLKMDMGKDHISFQDVLGMEQTASGEDVREAVKPAAQQLAQEIATQVLEVNGGPPSALFLAGGGSKLYGLRELVAKSLDMDSKRVALAGNNYQISAFSEVYDLNDPEYATPLGIAISAGLGLINDSYRITLNGQSAKLFRSGVLTVMDILMMNGYTSADLLGRTGQSLTVNIDGQRRVFRGQAAVPCVLRLNEEEVSPSTVVHAGDIIEFTPAQHGKPTALTLGEVLPKEFRGSVLLNGREAALDTLLRTGDGIVTLPYRLTSQKMQEETEEEVPPQKKQAAPHPDSSTKASDRPAVSPTAKSAAMPPVPAESKTSVSTVQKPAPSTDTPVKATATQATKQRTLNLQLNGKSLHLGPKEDGMPYHLMDLLAYSGLDLTKLERPVELFVNGENGAFSQEIQEQDDVIIRYRPD